MIRKLNRSYTHRTRDGRLARILADDRIGTRPIVVAILGSNGRESVFTYKEGLRTGIDSEENEFDLSPIEEDR